MKYETAATITAIRAQGHNRIVTDPNYGNLTWEIPEQFLLAEGLRVAVRRDPSPFNLQGKIAKAGECYLNRIEITAQERPFYEAAIFCSPDKDGAAWSQEAVDGWIARKVNQFRIGNGRVTALIGSEPNDAVFARSGFKRGKNTASVYEAEPVESAPKTRRIGACKEGARVKTADGLIWKLVANTPFACVLMDDHGDQRVITDVTESVEVL